MKRPVILLAALLLATAAQAQEFRTYEARNAIRQGQGGEHKIVDGIDMWERGDPPRRYQLLGSLEDDRSKSGLWRMLGVGAMDRQVANAAKQNGGDAVILVNENNDVVGVIGKGVGSASDANRPADAGAFSFGSAFEDKSPNARFMVIKYLPDGPVAPEPEPEPAPPPGE